jgi:hypothetical protein
MRANGLFVIEKNWRAHLLMRRKNFSAAQKRCPPENFCFTIRHSLFATRRRFAIRCRFLTCQFADFTICR